MPPTLEPATSNWPFVSLCSSNCELVLLTNPLLAVVTALLGLFVGIVIGRHSKGTEMADRERMLRELLPAACFVRRQVDHGEPSPRDPLV